MKCTDIGQSEPELQIVVMHVLQLLTDLKFN